MSAIGSAQIALVLAATVAAALPLSSCIARVLAGKRTFSSPVLAPIEGVFYKLSGIDPTREQSWFVLPEPMSTNCNQSGMGFMDLFLTAATLLRPCAVPSYWGSRRTWQDNPTRSDHIGNL